MPSSVIHLLFAKQMLDLGINIKDSSQFYLGVISPDAIHIRSDNRQEKKKTHLLPSTLTRIDIKTDEFIIKLKKFIVQNQSKVNYSFLLGYCTHILTDIFWDKNIGVKFLYECIKNHNKSTELERDYYCNISFIDQLILQNHQIKIYFCKQLQDAKESDLSDLLTANEMAFWKKRTLQYIESNQQKDIQTVQYIKIEMVQQFNLIYTRKIRDYDIWIN